MTSSRQHSDELFTLIGYAYTVTDLHFNMVFMKDYKDYYITGLEYVSIINRILNKHR